MLCFSWAIPARFSSIWDLRCMMCTRNASDGIPGGAPLPICSRNSAAFGRAGTPACVCALVSYLTPHTQDMKASCSCMITYIKIQHTAGARRMDSAL